YEPDFHLPMALCWPAATPGGRRVEDLISFVDLAPTFLSVAGVEAPAELVGRSLLSIVRARGSGRIEPERDRVFLGRERHDVGREGDVGYPVRCLRTPTHLYVRNFRPELWPVGNPETGYTGADSSPTKALILAQHARGEHHYYNLAFGKRPAEELYQIVDDPECLHNLAYDPAQAALRERLWQELRAELERTGDPRIFGNGAVFDGYEYVGKSDHSWRAYIEGRFKPQTY
ncbi:MAG TPA: sulfatase/phosphatase domain-containing protein, partial [Limnochordia bacterium]|nr:sulfatase/phosphatase domain-containing protein [Limnochordia bacterium]